MTAPTWGYSTASDSFRLTTGDAVCNTYNPDIGAIGPSKTLRRRPNAFAHGYGQKSGSSDCQWLWNDPLAVQSLWLYPNFFNCGSGPAVTAFVRDSTPYVPVNAIDATSPWDRVLIPNPDYECGTCYCAPATCTTARQRYRCGNFQYYSSAVLYILEAGPPNATAPIISYPTGSGGHWYWVVDFQALNAVSWSFNSDNRLTREAMSSAGVWGVDLTNTTPNFGGRNIGGIAYDGFSETNLRLQYAKEIDCNEDFEGDPITLTLDRYFQQFDDRTYVLDTYPSTVTITLTS